MNFVKEYVVNQKNKLHPNSNKKLISANNWEGS